MSMIAKHTLFKNSEKKHSVRYDVPEDVEGPAVTALYVKKDALPRPYPDVIVITIEDLPTTKED